MGFKRTSEGRVFFQRADNERANGGVPPEQNGYEDSPYDNGAGGLGGAVRNRMKNAASQVEVLGLLRTLNEHLKQTQMERDQIRKQLSSQRQMMAQLEQRAERSEKAYAHLKASVAHNPNEELMATQREMVQTRHALEQMKSSVSDTQKINHELGKRQAQLAASQKEYEKTLLQAERDLERHDQQLELHKQNTDKQIEDVAHLSQRLVDAETGFGQRLADAEAKQQSMHGQLQDTVGEQQKMSRQMEKVAKDRARFLRKMDRIEEIVLQTQTALTGQPLPLLGDGSAQAPYADGAQLPPQFAAGYGSYDQEDQEKGIQGFMRKTTKMHSVALIALVVAGVVGGWAISQFQVSDPYPNYESVSDSAFGEDRSVLANQSDELLSDAWMDELPADLKEQIMQATPVQELASDSAVGALTAQDVATPGAADDIGTIDLENEEELLAALSKAPNAVARQLNAIEPSNAAASARPIQEPNVTPNEALKQASAPARELEKQGERAAPPPSRAPIQTSKPVQRRVYNPSTVDQLRANIRPDRTLPEAVKQVENRAFRANAEAQHDLAAIYTAGHAGVEQSYRKAAIWFEEAGKHGVANAQYNLGVLFHQGLGVEKDLKKAIEMYQEAADLGHPEAQYNLGIAYIEGVGVRYDPFRAAEFFRNAAQGGIKEAAYNLGLIHENGLLGDAKPDEALMWYSAAAEQGSPEARAALEQLARSLNISMREVNNIVDDMKAQRPPADPVGVAVAETVTHDTGTSNWSGRRILVKQVQEQLAKLGLYDGAHDGLNGPRTQDAIRSYQALNNIKIDGNVSDDLLADLLLRSVNPVVSN